jgi:hypothetical protein
MNLLKWKCQWGGVGLSSMIFVDDGFIEDRSLKQLANSFKKGCMLFFVGNCFWYS